MDTITKILYESFLDSFVDEDLDKKIKIHLLNHYIRCLNGSVNDLTYDYSVSLYMIKDFLKRYRRSDDEQE